MEEDFIKQLYNKVQNASLEGFQEAIKPFVIDNLTGFYNRHFFGEQLPYIQERLLSSKKLATNGSSEYHNTILFADINNLKQVNDTRGYDTADQGIKRIIEIMNSNFSDFPARVNFRVGGDEFLILFPNSTRKDLVPHVRDIEKEIADSKDELNNLSIAMGLADTQEFAFSNFSSPLAREYFYTLISKNSIFSMQKRKREIKFGDVEAENYVTNYVSSTFQNLLRALGIEKPTPEELARVKQYIDNTLTDEYHSLSSQQKIETKAIKGNDSR